MSANFSAPVASLPQGKTGLTTDRHAPWYVWCGVLALTSSTFGMEWDIAWHDSIGRDTFWTPAHMMIYFCGVLSGIVCAYLVLASTFGRSPALSTNSVTVFGFRAPLGGFIATWGGLAMLVSAPFDNWWHAAYGLDVAVVTLPHTLLLVGIDLVGLGFLMLIAANMNRAEAAGARNYKQLQLLFVYLGGLMVFLHMISISALVERTWLHSSGTYRIIVLALMGLLAVISQASRHPWAVTLAALVYTGGRIATTLIFPLFPATPKLGPVLNPITHLMPLGFPVLILVPAIALDLLWQRTGRWKPWQSASAGGFLFVATLVPVEWFFGDFLMTKAAENRFFGTMYFDYWTRPVDRLPHFARVQTGLPLMRGVLIAAILAMVACWMGVRFGRWLRSVER